MTGDLGFASHGGVDQVAPLGNGLEALFVSRSGAVMITGWIDDRSDPVDCVNVLGAGWSVRFDGASLGRFRRQDLEGAAQRRSAYPYGYFDLHFADGPIAMTAECRVEVRLRSGAAMSAVVPVRDCDAEELRDVALTYLAGAQYFGDPVVTAISCLERGMGDHIVSLNNHVVSQLTAQPYVQRFGQPGGPLAGSIVVCLYGKPEFLFLQLALYAGLPGMAAYEFIFVSNSPELAERLLDEARICQTIYSMVSTVVILPGNAGFSAANNAAAVVARSSRLVFLNPDVFPRDMDWAQRHTALVADLPPDQTRLFGAPLYYDNGSLMHGGMYFDMDQGVDVVDRKTMAWRLMRVQHYGKGAPPQDRTYLRPRPVPAVTGAFISVEARWFETLEGFSTDYVFGHYEDADLCLRSLDLGFPAYLQDIKMWHLEGKGSTRLPLHEGGSLVNRWLFSSRWGQYCSPALLGPQPSLSAVRQPAPLDPDEPLTSPPARAQDDAPNIGRMLSGRRSPATTGGAQ